MKSIQSILQDNGIEFLDDIMNNYVIIYEKLNASTLSFSRSGEELKFYKGRDNEEITPVNAALYSYFHDGIDYIKRVSMIFYREFPEGWMFRMQYFVENKTNMIEYDYMPQNNLILSCIDTGSTIIEDPDTLKKWAERLQIDYAKPVFQGFLTEMQKERIKEYIDGGGVPEGVPFSQYIINLLNPQTMHSAYRNGFGGIDSFIFKFYKPNSKKCVCAKLVDPYMEELMKNNKGQFGSNDGCENEVVLANFLGFLKSINLSDVDVKGDTDDERYMDMICKLFNMYVEKNSKILKDINGSVKESYSVNIDKIPNKETAEILTKNPNLSTAFQIIVGSFMNMKNPEQVSPTSIFDETLIDMFNNEVAAIKRHTSEKDEQVKSFDELMKTSMGNSIEQAAKESDDEKIMSFTELMDKIGYSETDDESYDDDENKMKKQYNETNPDEKDDEKDDEEPKEKNEDDSVEKKSDEDVTHEEKTDEKNSDEDVTHEEKEEKESKESKEEKTEEGDKDTKEENKTEEKDSDKQEKEEGEEGEENGDNKADKEEENKEGDKEETPAENEDNGGEKEESKEEETKEDDSKKDDGGDEKSGDEVESETPEKSDKKATPAAEREEPEKTAPEPKSDSKPEKKEKEEKEKPEPKPKPEPKQNDNGNDGGSDGGGGGI